MKRTTIFADENMLDSLKEIARIEEKSIAEVIRQALNRFIADRQRNKRLPSILGIGQSGRKDIAERFEELLWKETPFNKDSSRGVQTRLGTTRQQKL